jgi:hypothetical protein
MWFKRKTKEEKQKEKEDKQRDNAQKLQAKLIHLRTEYAQEIDSYCKIGDLIFVFHGFKIHNSKIHVSYLTPECVPGYIKIENIVWFEMRHGTTDFKKARHEFLKFKDNLSKIGLKLEKI